MKLSRYVPVIAACFGASVLADSASQPFPAESDFAKADPSLQRLLVSALDRNSTIIPGGPQTDGWSIEPAEGIEAKCGLTALRLSANAKTPDARAEFLITRHVPGQAKKLGVWVNLPADSKVANFSIQITDSEGEPFVHMANVTPGGWQWVEADVNSTSFTPGAKPGDKPAKNGTIDFPLSAVRLNFTFQSPGRAAAIVDGACALSDLGNATHDVPLSIGDIGELTLDTNGPLNAQAVFTNYSDAPIEADVEYIVQTDPELYSKVPPLPKYGVNVAVGARSWYEIGGKTIENNNALTDGRDYTAFGGPMNNKDMWEEAFAYVDLGKPYRIVHMSRNGGEAGRMFKADFAASLDGKTYTPVEGMQNIDWHRKWGAQPIPVPKPFEARFIRIRQHNAGERVPVISLPGELYVYDGERPDTWDFPQTGQKIFDGQQRLTIPARNFHSLSIGDGRPMPPGSYFVAMRVKSGGVTQMKHGRFLVMPPPMESVTAASRFGMNGIAFPAIGRRQGFGWVRFENLKWPKVSHEPDIYSFDGSLAGEPNFDQLFKGYKDHGLEIMPFLFLTAKYMLPKDGKPNVLTYPPTDMSKYGQFVFQAVARYGSKKHPPEVLLTNDKVSGLGYINLFELWNEADLNDPNWGSWRGKFEDFYIMYRHGAEAVKQADPDALIANGGWSGMGVPLMESMRTYKYPDGKSPLDFTDVLSVHYYSFRVPPERAMVNDNTNRNGAPLFGLSFEQELEALVEWRDRVKPQMPIWMTETGYDTGGPKGVDERLQAAWLPRDIMLILAAGVEKVFVYRETGSGPNLFSASGLLRDDTSYKPGWFTYATLIRQLDGVVDRPIRMRFEDPNIRAYLWKSGERLILSAWAIEGSAELPLPSGQCTITDAFGSSSQTTIAGALKLSEFPVYITDFSPSASAELLALARSMDEKHRQHIERQSNLRAYLYTFGGTGRSHTMIIGKERTFTDVVAADLYDEAKGYGFESAGLADRNDAWLRPTYSVRMRSGAAFKIKAQPGTYELKVCARAPTPCKFVVQGIEGGPKAFEAPSSRDGATASVVVKAGAGPISIQAQSNSDLVWITMVESEGTD